MAVNFDEIIDRKGTSCLKYDFAQKRGYPADVLPFWVADMDFRAPQVVIDAIKKRTDHGIFGYTNFTEEYEAVIADWMTRYHNWTPANGSLVITPGVVFAISMAITAFTEPGDAIIIQQPVYYPFGATIKNNGRQLVNNSLKLVNGHYEIDFDDFEAKIKDNNVKLFLLCSPQNPAGRVWHKDELQKLADICLKHHVLILADEIHHEFIRPGHQHTVLASLSPEIAQNVITCTAPSKTFNLAGLQLSNIFIENPELRKRFKTAIYNTGYDEPNVLGFAAAQAAYTHGRPWLDEALAYIEKNIQFAKKYLAEHLTKVRFIDTEGTYLIWLDFNAYGLSVQELEDIIVHKAKLWLDSGHIFGQEGNGFQRINVACPQSVLKQGLDQLIAAFKDL